MKRFLFGTCRLIIINFFLLSTLAGHAQPRRMMKPVLLNAGQKQKVVKHIGQLMKDHYAFPKVADKMAAYLDKQQKNKAYASIKSAQAFGHILTRDLQKISKDKHIALRFSPQATRRMNSGGRKSNPNTRRRNEALERSQNYGFRRVEILEGNIGYLNLSRFYSPTAATETVASVMGFLANTEGIIVDLRRNGGGSPRMVQLLASYFFNEKPVHLNSIHYRKGNRTEEFWTLKDIKGKRMPNKPLYVLTSDYTFSAAEEFSYDLQSLKRATIVGETTGGGANPGGFMPVADLYTIFVPTGRAINPTTKNNWEGVGVVPNIKVSADQALDKAHLELIKSAKAKSKNPTGYDWVIAGLEAKTNPVKLSVATLKSYAGDYTNRRIILKDGQLYYQRPSVSKNLRKLTPLTAQLFAVEGVADFRIKFEKVSNGKAGTLQGLYQRGRRDLSKRGSITK